MHFRDSEEQFAEGLEFVARDEQVIGGAHAIPCLFGWFQFRRGLREWFGLCAHIGGVVDGRGSARCRWVSGSISRCEAMPQNVALTDSMAAVIDSENAAVCA